MKKWLLLLIVSLAVGLSDLDSVKESKSEENAEVSDLNLDSTSEETAEDTSNEELSAQPGVPEGYRLKYIQVPLSKAMEMYNEMKSSNSFLESKTSDTTDSEDGEKDEEEKAYVYMPTFMSVPKSQFQAAQKAQVLLQQQALQQQAAQQEAFVMARQRAMMDAYANMASLPPYHPVTGQQVPYAPEMPNIPISEALHQFYVSQGTNPPAFFTALAVNPSKTEATPDNLKAYFLNQANQVNDESNEGEKPSPEFLGELKKDLEKELTDKISNEVLSQMASFEKDSEVSKEQKKKFPPIEEMITPVFDTPKVDEGKTLALSDDESPPIFTEKLDKTVDSYHHKEPTLKLDVDLPEKVKLVPAEIEKKK